MTRPCPSCSTTTPRQARYCPSCGAFVGEPVLTLQEALDTLQLHPGHDFRGSERDAAGNMCAVRMLGASESIIARLREMVPSATIVEKQRRPNVGASGDWIRVDVTVAKEG